MIERIAIIRRIHYKTYERARERANKGIFITTSNFSNDALDYAKGVSPKIVLIDGRKLADLMIEHDAGVSEVGSYEVKRIDLDFFTES